MLCLICCVCLHKVLVVPKLALAEHTPDLSNDCLLFLAVSCLPDTVNLFWRSISLLVSSHATAKLLRLVQVPHSLDLAGPGW